MHDVVATLVHLDPSALHARSGAAAKRPACAAWEPAACPVAMERPESRRSDDVYGLMTCYGARCVVE